MLIIAADKKILFFVGFFFFVFNSISKVSLENYSNLKNYCQKRLGIKTIQGLIAIILNIYIQLFSASDIWPLSENLLLQGKMSTAIIYTHFNYIHYFLKLPKEGSLNKVNF